MATQEQIASVIALQQDGDTGLVGWENGQYKGEINDPAELYSAKDTLEDDFEVTGVVLDALTGGDDTTVEQASYTVTYSDGSTVDETSIATWTSSNPEFATVDGEGIVTAVATGASDITATVDGESDTVTFTVA